MRAPYGLEIIESCLSCPHREDRLFCNLSPPAVERLAAITSAAAYPKGATLFVEGQSPRGVFILCSGKVKLSTSSADGRSLILRISESGEVLGLPATVTGKPYELTADVIEPTQANFISRSLSENSSQVMLNSLETNRSVCKVVSHDQDLQNLPS
jgi:CRP/FNR family cyclic AMP-dependent transcriptional regulator